MDKLVPTIEEILFPFEPYFAAMASQRSNVYVVGRNTDKSY